MAVAVPTSQQQSSVPVTVAPAQLPTVPIAAADIMTSMFWMLFMILPLLIFIPLSRALTEGLTK